MFRWPFILVWGLIVQTYAYAQLSAKTTKVVAAALSCETAITGNARSAVEIPDRVRKLLEGYAPEREIDLLARIYETALQNPGLPRAQVMRMVDASDFRPEIEFIRANLAELLTELLEEKAPQATIDLTRRTLNRAERVLQKPFINYFDYFITGYSYRMPLIVGIERQLWRKYEGSGDMAERLNHFPLTPWVFSTGERNIRDLNRYGVTPLLTVEIVDKDFETFIDGDEEVEEAGEFMDHDDLHAHLKRKYQLLGHDQPTLVEQIEAILDETARKIAFYEFFEDAISSMPEKMQHLMNANWFLLDHENYRRMLPKPLTDAQIDDVFNLKNSKEGDLSATTRFNDRKDIGKVLIPAYGGGRIYKKEIQASIEDFKRIRDEALRTPSVMDGTYRSKALATHP